MALPERTRLYIDIGGGRDAEYFQKLARQDPHNTYLVLDPSIKGKPKDCLSNLYLVRWGSGENFGFPLPNHCVDMVYVNFMYGQLRGDDIQNLKAFRSGGQLYEADYIRLLRQVREVLKPDGRLFIAETRCWMNVVQRIVGEERFTITKAPSRLPDEDRTLWSKIFFFTFHLAEQLGKSESESQAIPLGLEATSRKYL